MTEQNKAKTICAQLERDILSGRYDGQRFPSDRMLMRRFAVARATVQSAMRELVARKLVDRRLGRGTFLLERADLSAARTFGIIVPDAYYPFYVCICRGIEETARAHGWKTLTASLGTGNPAERAARAVAFAALCGREHVGGVFFQPLQFVKDGERINGEILRGFNAADIPVVLLDSDYVAPPRRSGYDLVGLDNTAAGYELARHLIRQGARHIWYFSNPLPAPTSLKRGNGVGVAVVEAGLRWTREHVVFCNPSDVATARRVFAGRNRPDGIVAVNDHVAAILLKTLRAAGIRVPEDVMLVGVNGDPVAEAADLPLTTAVQPCHEIGAAAVELMLRRLANRSLPPQSVQFTATLAVRGSSIRNRPKRANGKSRKKGKQ